MAHIDDIVGCYLDCKHKIDDMNKILDGYRDALVELIGEGGAHTTPNGVKVKITPPSVTKRFDWKKYIGDHPEVKSGYMVDVKRKGMVRVTEPKKEDLDEFGWEA